jgi:hypothetical protein
MDELLQRLRAADPLRHDEVPEDAVERAFRDAHRLAKRAYGEGDRAALRQAERTLYVIHTANRFAPPMEGVACAVWNVLVRHKLNAVVRPHLSRGYSSQDMRDVIDAQVAIAQQLDHVVFDEIARANPSRGFLIYAKNWEAHVYGFSQHLISLAQRSTGRMQKMVAQMIVEELLPPVDHDNLRARLMQGLGLDVSTLDRLDDPDVVFESQSVMNYRTAVTLIPNPYVALGSFYSIEAAFPDACRRMLAGLRPLGLDEATLEYLTLHGEVDVHHSSDWIEALQASPLDAYERACVVAGALAQLEERHAMFQAIRAQLASGAVSAPSRG